MYYLVNIITLYRLLSAPVLIYFAFTNRIDVFKWLLAVSFFTDAIDGPIARKYRVTSIMGSKLDSISDDLTVLAGIMGLIVFRRDFLREEILPVAILLALFVCQVTMAFARFKRMTSFHTYLAKLAAVCQGIFLITAFFLPEPSRVLFYVAMAVTALDLMEEIILVRVVREWAADVKGLYWVLKKQRGA